MKCFDKLRLFEQFLVRYGGVRFNRTNYIQFAGCFCVCVRVLVYFCLSAARTDASLCPAIKYQRRESSAHRPRQSLCDWSIRRVQHTTAHQHCQLLIHSLSAVSRQRRFRRALVIIATPPSPSPPLQSSWVCSCSPFHIEWMNVWIKFSFRMRWRVKQLAVQPRTRTSPF